MFFYINFGAPLLERPEVPEVPDNTLQLMSGEDFMLMDGEPFQLMLEE